jgi:hypothetical protein
LAEDEIDLIRFLDLDGQQFHPRASPLGGIYLLEI